MIGISSKVSILIPLQIGTYTFASNNKAGYGSVSDLGTQLGPPKVGSLGSEGWQFTALYSNAACMSVNVTSTSLMSVGLFTIQATAAFTSAWYLNSA
jgi:hypothetical protein